MIIDQRRVLRQAQKILSFSVEHFLLKKKKRQKKKIQVHEKRKHSIKIHIKTKKLTGQEKND
jgi:hypothetical protein